MHLIPAAPRQGWGVAIRRDSVGARPRSVGHRGLAKVPLDSLEK